MISNIHLYKIFELSPLPTIILMPDAPEFTIVYVNNAYLKITGTTEKGLVGKSILEIFSKDAKGGDPGLNSLLLQSFQNLLNTKCSHKLAMYEIEIQKSTEAKNVKRYWDIEHLPLLDENNEISYIIQAVEDVTEKVELIKRHQQLETEVLIKQLPLQSRNKFIETILQNLPIGIAVNNIDDGKATFVNKRFSETYGWSPGDLKDITSFFQKVYPDEGYRKEILERVMRDIESKEPGRMNWDDINITTSTGEKRVINAKNIPLYEQNLMISTVIDVTQSARHSAELDRIKANQEALINGTEDLIWSIDEKMCIISANHSFHERVRMETGNTPKEGDFILYKDYGEEVNKKWSSYYKRALNGEKITVKEEYLNSRLQRMEYCQVSFSPSYNKLGHVNGVVCFLKDITEETLSLKTLEGVWSELNKIMGYSLDVICTIDKHGDFIKISSAAEKLWGYQPNELVGRSYLKKIHKEDINRTKKALEKMKSGELKTNFENRFLHKNGTSVPMMWSASWDDLEKIMYCIARDESEKTKDKEALIDSEKKYKFLFENNPSPMFIWDFETLRIIDCNEEALLKYGYTRKEFLELTIKDIRPEEDIPYIMNATKNEDSYHKVHKNIWRHRKKNGQLMLMEISGHLINYNGRQVSIVHLTDVTERENTLRLLKENEAKLLSAQKIAKLGYWRVYPGQKGLYWSDEVYNIWGINHHNFNLDYDSFLNTVHHDDKQSIVSAHAIALKDRIDIDIEYRIHLPGNSVKWVHEKGKLITNKNSIPILLEGTVQDITAEKLLALSLEESNKRYEHVTKATTDAIWDWDLITGQLYLGEGFQTIFGYNTIGLQNDSQSWIENIHPEDHERVINKEFSLIDSSETKSAIEYRFKKADNTYAYVLDRGFIIRDNTGKAIRMVGAMQDVTKRKEEEIHKELIAEVSLLFNGNMLLNKTLERVLESLLNYGNFNLAEAWVISPEHNKINLVANLVINNEIKKFYKETSEIKSFAKGEGLPGITWQNHTLQVWKDINKYKKFVRQKAAKKSGIHTVFGVPLIHNNKMIGVLILGLNKNIQIPNSHLTLFENIGPQLGSEIERKQLEQQLNQIFEFAPDVICIAGTDGYFKKMNRAGCELLEYTEAEVLASPVTYFVHPDDVKEAENKIENVKTLSSTSFYENRLITKSGAIKWLAWTYTPSPEEGLVFAVAKDITERKNLESLLNKSNKLAAIGSWEIDVINNTVYWSDITKEIREADADFDPDLSTGMQNFMEGNSRDTIFKIVQECIKNGTPWDEELQIVTQKGNLKWIRTIGEGEFINGKCIKVYGSFQDIDEKKRSEIKVLKLYEEKITILESIGDAFFAVDNNWIVTYWNNQAEKLLHTPKEKILSRNLWEVFHDSIDSVSFKKYHEAIETSRVIHFEDYYLPIDKWYEISAYPSGSGLAVYFKDITDRKKTEEVVKLSNERYSIIAKATNDSIWDWDLHKNEIVRPDKTLENLLGYDDISPAKVDEFWKNHVHREDWRRMTEQRNMLFINPEKNYWEDEYRFLKKDGNYAIVYDRGYIIRDENGKAIRMIGASRDITKIKESEAELKILNEQLNTRAKELAVSNAELEQFAYIASHDLQEPLRMVTSFLSQIEKKYGDVLDENGQQYIHFAVDGAKRMRQIILDLLEYSRAGRTKATREEVNLNEIITEIISLHRNQINEKKAVIKINNLPTFITSKTPLRQIFQNLISNSLKYNNKAVPKITISSKSTKTHWLFSVKDNGIGIEPQYFNRIFILFQRLHNKDEFSGTGIGLAITKKIIENLGGTIWLESEEGKGSTFYFTIEKISTPSI